MENNDEFATNFFSLTEAAIRKVMDAIGRVNTVCGSETAFFV